MIAPYNEQAERDVLGAAMLTRSALDHVLETLTVEDFYTPPCAALFAAMVSVVRRGEAPDPTVLASALHAAGHLELVGGRQGILAMKAEVPASANVRSYAALVADCAARRRLMVLASEATTAAADPSADFGGVLGALQNGLEHVALPTESFAPPTDAADLVAVEDVYDWKIPKLLEAGDRVIWTAGEGVGKSEMQLQLAATCASGIHPFQRYPIRALRVLLVDLENSERQLRRRLRRLLASAGERYKGGLGVVSKIDGIDVRDPRQYRWLDRLCEHHRPDLLVIGPLYKTFRVRGRESKSDETAAEEAAYAFDKLRARHGCAVSIEAHAPHGTQNDRDGYRPYGASLWLRWPEFGFGLKRVPGEPSVEVKHWRGSRDRDREWPEVLTQGRFWPWEPVERKAVA